MSKFMFGDMDILSLLNSWSFAYLVFLSAFFAYTLLRGGRSELRLAMFSVFVILSIGYFLAQYPLLADQDYYLHGATAKLILLESHVSFAGYEAYPMSFLLTTMTTVITSAGILQSMQILFCVTQIVSFLAVYVCASAYCDELGRAMVMVLSTYFVFDFSRNFSPALYGFSLFLVLVIPWLRHSRIGRKWFLCILFLTSAILLGHPITSLYVLGLFFMLFLFRRGSLTMFLSVGMAFLAWSVYLAATFFNSSVTYFYQTFILREELAVITQRTVPILDLMRSISPVVLAVTLFKWVSFATIVTLGLLYTLRRRSDGQMKNIAAVLAGLILGGVLLGASPVGWLERLIPPVSVICLLVIGRQMTRLGKKSVVLLAILLVPAFVAAHPSFFVYEFHPYEYATFVHGWEVDVAAFADMYTSPISKGGSAVISTDQQTYIIYQYFDPYSDPYSGVNWVSPYSDFNKLAALQPTVFEGDIMIRSTRQELISHSSSNLDLSFWGKVDLQLSDKYLKIYSNGWTSIYANSSEPFSLRQTEGQNARSGSVSLGNSSAVPIEDQHATVVLSHSSSLGCYRACRTAKVLDSACQESRYSAARGPVAGIRHVAP